jgi:hypothetical protein
MNDAWYIRSLASWKSDLPATTAPARDVKRARSACPFAGHWGRSMRWAGGDLVHNSRSGRTAHSRETASCVVRFGNLGRNSRSDRTDRLVEVRLTVVDTVTWCM